MISDSGTNTYCSCDIPTLLIIHITYLWYYYYSKLVLLIIINIVIHVRIVQLSVDVQLLSVDSK